MRLKWGISFPILHRQSTCHPGFQTQGDITYVSPPREEEHSKPPCPCLTCTPNMLPFSADPSPAGTALAPRFWDSASLAAPPFNLLTRIPETKFLSLLKCNPSFQPSIKAVPLYLLLAQMGLQQISHSCFLKNMSIRSYDRYLEKGVKTGSYLLHTGMLFSPVTSKISCTGLHAQVMLTNRSQRESKSLMYFLFIAKPLWHFQPGVDICMTIAMNQDCWNWEREFVGSSVAKKKKSLFLGFAYLSLHVYRKHSLHMLFTEPSEQHMP